jgi:hypothetical protein
MNRQKFISEYGFSISLPDNWSEYDLEDEKNTNGFFDTSEWTGNLRITPLKVQVDYPYDFIKNELTETDYKEFTWDNIKALNYSEESDDLYIYYWHLIEKKKIYICSFTIDSKNKESVENKKELVKIEEILKTVKTELFNC